MKVELRVKNIVLVGLFINPNLFDKYFFIKNEIASEGEILENSMFGGVGGTQLICDKFNVVAAVNQIVVSANFDMDINIKNIALKVIRGLEGEKGIMLLSAGINFNWFLFDDIKSSIQISRECFYNEKLILFNKFFDSEDSAFGVYASTNFINSRLKLDIKPATVLDPRNRRSDNLVGFMFNFHFDVINKNEAIKEIGKYINDYDLYLNHSKEISGIYTE